MLTCITERWPYISSSPSTAVSEALGNFFSVESIFLFFSYFLPLGFLPLLSPLWALPALFNVTKDMLAAYEMQKHLIQYTAPAIPFLFAALIQTLRVRRKGLNPLFKKKSKKILLGVLVAMLFSLNLLTDFVDLPRGLTFGAVRLPGSHEEAIDRLVALVPDGVTITTPNHIFPHLCTRTYTCSPYDPGEEKLYSQYAIIDLQNVDDYKDNPPGQNTSWGNHFENEYEVILRVDDVLLLKRGYTSSPGWLMPD
jgi:uncharacterized membrane protein